MQIQRTLPGPEDIVTFAADHLSHQHPAVAGLTHDLRSAYCMALILPQSMHQTSLELHQK